ncbi:MAG: hypothetical protein F4X64_00015 [Chloroflexi bacterium]|nr:hypothetical protein [Chloroflexota bacterium]
MDFETFNFRNALAILQYRPEWGDLRSVIGTMTREMIIDKQEEIAARRQRPKGAQVATNALFREKLSHSPWQSESRLFEQDYLFGNSKTTGWKMDFLIRGDPLTEGSSTDFGMGVEIAFNHAEAIPWTLIRMNLAAQFEDVRRESRIDVGIGIFASEAFKSWGRLDGAAGTFEQAQRWLSISRHAIPTPILLIGLRPRDDESARDWDPTDAFPGTGKG